MKKDQLEIQSALESHFRVHRATPCETRKYLGHTVYLAESGPHYDANRINLSDEDQWMSSGYYLSCWGVIRDNLAVWGRPAYFKLSHNNELTKKAQKDARLNAAMADAEDYIRMGVRSGLLKNKSVLIL